VNDARRFGSGAARREAGRSSAGEWLAAAGGRPKPPAEPHSLEATRSVQPAARSLT